MSLVEATLFWCRGRLSLSRQQRLGLALLEAADRPSARQLAALLSRWGIRELWECGCLVTIDGEHEPCARHQAAIPRACRCGVCQLLTRWTAKALRAGADETVGHWRAARLDHYERCFASPETKASEYFMDRKIPQ